MRVLAGWTALLVAAFALAQLSPRIIEITADHDSRYRIAGHANPTISMQAGERVILRITAIKAKSKNRDGAIHGFVLMNKNDQKVPGWAFELKPGTQDFEVTAPSVPGDYKVVCSVICSDNHESMHMTVRVIPNETALETSK